jgi:GNAT superfamily N-acetyltransferase
MVGVISYSTDVHDVHPDRLAGFFDGWPVPPGRGQLSAVLRHSYRAIVATDPADPAAAHAHTAPVVGFVTAISDGVLTAFVPWLEVLPGYRKRGIGSELVLRMLTELDHLYSIDLVCDEQLRPFYERLGLVALTGMGWRNPSALHGQGVPAGNG